MLLQSLLVPFARMEADWSPTARFERRLSENTIGLVRGVERAKETNSLHPLISNEIIVVTDADFLPLLVRELLTGGFRGDGFEIALTRRARRKQN